MGYSAWYRDDMSIEFSWTELTGAIGDSVTVLPIVVAVALLTELSLAAMLIWFGVFQVVWGVYFGVPISVEPMKALAALVIAGAITAGELLIAGLLLGGVLVVVGRTGTLDRIAAYIGSPVIRGIQFGVALVLLETGLGLGAGNLGLAIAAAALAGWLIAIGYANVSAFAVLLFGGAIAATQTGMPTPSVPSMGGLFLIGASDLSLAAGEATIAQLAMTLGNAALATSLLLGDYFDRSISPDELASSMGVMNLASIPFGAFPMCHGSGGVAGKYAFGARTAGANVILGIGYVVVAIFAVGIVAAYPLAMLGIVLVLVALQLGHTSLRRTDRYPLVIAIGAIGLLVNLGVAFVVGVLAYLLLQRQR